MPSQSVLSAASAPRALPFRPLAALLLVAGLLVTGVTPAHAAGFRGPLSTAADPYMTWYRGNYYLAETDARDVYMRVSPTIGGLLGADRQLIWHPTDPAASQNVWAPSFMILNDRWYLYYTADDGIDEHHRMFAIESTGTVSGGALPNGPYAMKGRVYDPANDNWAIDGLPFQANGKLYFVWSGAVNATATYSFRGSRFALLSVQDTGNGIAGISVDGGAEVTVDTYAAIRQGEQLQWLIPRLFTGDHTVRIRVTGQRNGASSNTYVGVDRVEVYP